MGVKDSVFASKAERGNFRKLESRWGEKYAIWHNLPFLNIFNRDALLDIEVFPPTTIEVSDLDWNRLKKTSVDYVLCDSQTHKPLIAIDFDGMCGGFNIGRKYVTREAPGEWRDLITRLKLKVAHGSLFPYFVVGSQHFSDVSQQIEFCIVDGIIGEVLSKIATTDQFSKGFQSTDIGLSQEEWDSLSPFDQNTLFENWAFDVEFSNDLEHNPIYSRIRDLFVELGPLHGHHRLIGSADGPFYGAELVLETDDVGVVTKEAWLPRFGVPGFSGLGLAEEIAHLLALDEVRRRRTL